MNVRFNQDFRIPAGPDFNVVLSVPVVTIPAKSQNYMGLGAMERVLSGFPAPDLAGLPLRPCWDFLKGRVVCPMIR